MPVTENWTVLCSLNIAESQRKFCCEIDFLRLVPKLGIFVIEVKPGGQKRVNSELFITESKGKIIKLYKDAFKQASDTKYDLIKQIKKHFKNIKETKYFISYGLVFPNIPFPLDSIEIERWRICDINTIGFFKDFINNLIKNDLQKYSAINNRNYHEIVPLNESGIRNLLNYLRPCFDNRISYSQSFKDNDSYELQLLEEQFGILQLLVKYGSYIVSGPPGQVRRCWQ